MAGPHDLMQVRTVDDGAVAVCRCGLVLHGFDRREAEEAHEAHFNKVTVHTPGLADARRALEGGADA